ncbi:MAG: hypothetical protein JXR70_12670 [Spirochaetales bacterium]|nr:hypothetical protein [Spirochaetales bacterium]
MKQIIIILIIFFLIGCNSTQGFFPEPCFKPEINSLELNDYFFLYDSIMDGFGNTDLHNGDAFRNSQYAEYYKQILEPEIIKCDFTITRETNGLISRHSGVIYFSRGYLYIRHFDSFQGELDFDQHNYITRPDGVYSWKQGDNQGTVFQRYSGDTLTFLTFYIDPKAVMRELFWASRMNPQLFETTEKGPLKTENFKDANSQYKNFSYFENPLWLSEFTYTLGNSNFHFTIAKPRQADCIPQSLTRIPENIEWTFSNQSLASRQYYR